MVALNLTRLHQHQPAVNWYNRGWKPRYAQHERTPAKICNDTNESCYMCVSTYVDHMHMATRVQELGALDRTQMITQIYRCHRWSSWELRWCKNSCWPVFYLITSFVSSHMYPENPEEREPHISMVSREIDTLSHHIRDETTSLWLV